MWTDEVIVFLVTVTKRNDADLAPSVAIPPSIICCVREPCRTWWTFDHSLEPRQPSSPSSWTGVPRVPFIFKIVIYWSVFNQDSGVIVSFSSTKRSDNVFVKEQVFPKNNKNKTLLDFFNLNGLGACLPLQSASTWKWSSSSFPPPKSRLSGPLLSTSFITQGKPCPI